MPAPDEGDAGVLAAGADGAAFDGLPCAWVCGAGVGSPVPVADTGADLSAVSLVPCCARNMPVPTAPSSTTAAMTTTAKTRAFELSL